MTQARQILTLLNGEADLMWCVTSDEREEQLILVRFPLIPIHSDNDSLGMHPAVNEQGAAMQ